MDKNMQIYEMVAGGMDTASFRQPGMAYSAIRRNTEPCYVTYGGETFYIGNEGKPPVNRKIRRHFFSRIFRHRNNKEKNAWKEVIA